MELDMKKNIKSNDKISEGTLHEILLDIKYRLDHMEDMEADNRALIVKLVKQNNSIVKFLSSAMEVSESDFDKFHSNILEDKVSKTDRFKNLNELIEEFVGKKEDLKEFEEELKKNKDKLTPGQMGES